MFTLLPFDMVFILATLPNNFFLGCGLSFKPGSASFALEPVFFDCIQTLFISETYESIGDLKKAEYYYKQYDIECYENDIQKKKNIKTQSGVMVQSQGEKMIADFLFTNQVDFDYDKVITLKGNEDNVEGYKTSWIRPDFFLTEFDVIIEYWGLKGDCDYDTKMDIKKRLYKESGKRFISIIPENLKELDHILKTKLERLGCKVK